MKRILNGLLLITSSFLAIMCANQVSPSGGPRDTKPPEFIKSEPPQYSKNFKSNKVRIFFNEFVQLKEINQQVIISPPMAKLPEFKLKGKSVVMEFKEDLKENTTYNIFFGDAIVDLTENNPIANFQYVFSTGDVLDSLSLKGKVYEAFDLSTLEDNNVMLYLDNNDTIPYDSLPLLVRPYYMSKTNEEGEFILNNLPDKDFKIFVLWDQNGNLIYDQPNEKIAFIDSLTHPFFIQPKTVDTGIVDTLAIDTIINVSPEFRFLDLYLFQETDSVQRFLKAVLAQNNQMNLIFKRPTINAEANPLNLPAGTDSYIDWSIKEVNKTNDTITYWLKNIDQDSLIIELINNNEILDTVKVALKKKIRGRKPKKEEGSIQTLSIKSNVNGKVLKLDENLKLVFGYPVSTYNFSNIVMLENDTVPITPEIFFTDSNLSRRLSVNYKWEPATSYKMVIPDSCFIDIHGHSHDTTLLTFRTKSIEDYGNLFLDLQLSKPNTNHIIQLLKKEKVEKEIHVTQNERISFEYLDPGKYQVKVIYDQNNNGEWDTGDYYYKIQPEKVDFFPNEITIRANWDMEEVWEL